MNRSVASRASNASSQMLEEIANRSQTRIYRVEGTMNDEEMRVIWNALGLYISRNLRMGRGVNIPKLGIFTFTPPEVRLKGVTNEQERDQQPRTPVFLIQKDFVKGVPLRTAIFYHQQFGSGLRPYSAIGATGEVPVTKMNLIEVSSYANMSKDATELGINRIIKYISEKLHSGQNIVLQLPNLGQLICRSHLVGVKFNQYVVRDTRNVLAKSVDDRKLRGNMSLTSDNLKRLNNVSQMSFKLGNKSQDFFEIDPNTRQYLSSTFNIHIDDSNMKRSMTGFDRSVASKLFDRTNKSLKESYNMRFSQSGFFNGHSSTSKEFNMALRCLKEWIRDSGYNTRDAYSTFCSLAGKKNQVLTPSDVWNACRQISSDITQQQALQLFRILDNNKDGMVTWEDWSSNIHFNHNNKKFKELQQYIRSKKYTISKVLNLLGFEGVRKVSVFTLKQGLMRLWSKLSDEEALLLSKFIAQEKDEIEVERIIDSLSISDNQPVEVDSQWQSRFLARIKRKLQQHRVSEQQLFSKFKLYDTSNSGYIEQTDFKTVLGELGISLNLTELIKVVKFVPINSKNHLKYQYLTDKLLQTQASNKEDLSDAQFKSVMKKLLTDKLPFSIPISVSKLTSWLQSRHFKQCQEREVLKHVRSIDLNEDEQIDADDMRHYRELISDKVYRSMDNKEVQELLNKMRERRIKKKNSVYDLFRKLDKVGSGFITHEGWHTNLNDFIVFTEDEKENLFNYLDRNKNKVIDYKSFQNFMNGSADTVQSQKFDWAEKTLENIKQWFFDSKLTSQDAFNLIDNDADGYLSQKDLHQFLVRKLKVQERQLGMVRLQKLMKIMDCYKHGRITYIDWLKLINEKKDWLADAKQQIGIILSKHHPSLNEAFYTISTGDKKLMYSAFQKWIRNNHVLSGFMVNEDMLKHIFNCLDQHKKGYLLQNDFVGLFRGYDWKSEHCKEVTDFLKYKFNSAEEAFRYMSEYSNKSVNYDRFKQVMNEFFKDRFQPSDSKNIWKTLAGGREQLDLPQFKKLHDHLWKAQDDSVDRQFPKDSWQYQDFSIIKGTTVRSSEFNYEEREKMEDQCKKFINNLKNILASSPKTLEQAFLEVDSQKNGRITNLMFKKAFRNLNIALTSKQIDLLLNYCEYKPETLIDWKKFIKMLDLHQDKVKIRSRLQPKLQHISDLLHYYMISPKDAFRKWNNPRTGYLNFEQFHKMMKEICNQANEEPPSFQQLEDIFKFIDVRGDKNIDFQEWTQMFRTCTPPSLLMGTTPAPSNEVTSKPTVDHEAAVPIKQRSIPKFRNSQAYEEFVHLIGRNRRYLQSEFEKSKNDKSAFIPFSNVEEVIREFAGKHKMNVDSGMVRNLIAFAMTGEKVDYNLLVNRFKDLNVEIAEFPKAKVY